MDITELLSAYQAAQKAKGRRERGIQGYCDSVRQFVRWLEHEPTCEALTVTTLRQFQEYKAQTCKPVTVAAHLCGLRSFCQWCIRYGHMAHDPTLELEWPRKVRPLPRPAHRNTIRKLLQNLATPPTDATPCTIWQWQRNRRAIYLMLYAGLRISEAANLCWQDVDLEIQVLWVRNGKFGKDRLIPLGTNLETVLREVETPQQQSGFAVAGKHNGECLTRQSMAHVFERWLPREIGIRLSAHQLRHAFATRLDEQGVSVRVIQELLGHASLDTTMRYLGVDNERKREAVAKLNEAW